MFKKFTVTIFAFSLLIIFPRLGNSQPIQDYTLTIALIADALIIGSGNITNVGKAGAYANVMNLAQANAQAASDGFESGDVFVEISHNPAADGNLRAAQQLLEPDDEESQELIETARYNLSVLRAAALDRLTGGENTCDNGTLDPGEECDNSSGQDSCPAGSFCLEDCMCSELR
jgi:hypothetical protein